MGEYDRECTKCGTIFIKTSPTITLCNSCNSERVKNENPNLKMWRRAKSRAKVKGIPFDIEPSDIEIPETCPILGMPLIVYRGASGGRVYSPTLDRIDNDKGYIKGNVQVISHLANMMKSCASPLEIYKFGVWALKNYKFSVESS